MPLSTIRKNRRKPPDLLCDLPPDISVQIIDMLRADDLRHVPQVSPHWASLFSAGSDLESGLRALVTRRFGLRHRPSHAKNLSWGELYLALRRERCHLCPAKDVAPFVYAGSSTLAMTLQSGDGERLALFPVCGQCFARLVSSSFDSFVPVVEKKAVEFVFPGAKGVEGFAGMGFLYSDIPGFGEKQQDGIEFALAWPLARRFPNHRFCAQRVEEAQSVTSQ